jgi:hypothetical protein
MWLQTPDTIEHVLAKRQLEPASEEEPDQSTRKWHRHGAEVTPREALRSLPVVEIGIPETWLLSDFYSPRKLPRPILAKLKEADFYLVRLSCSFLPPHEESSVEWARFRATLLPHPTTKEQPLAFDLYPSEVVQAVKRHLKITLNPLLKFQEWEASLGSAEFGIEYSEIIPRIKGYIGDSVAPIWDYSAGSDRTVQGTKWMHLLVKAPKGMTGGHVQLELEADVLVKGTHLSAVLRHQQKQASTQLTVPLWG